MPSSVAVCGVTACERTEEGDRKTCARRRIGSRRRRTRRRGDGETGGRGEGEINEPRVTELDRQDMDGQDRWDGCSDTPNCLILFILAILFLPVPPSPRPPVPLSPRHFFSRLRTRRNSSERSAETA